MDRTGRARTKRPWLAALLAIVHPGLGHAYLREWARALLWFGLMLTAASLLVPESLVPAAVTVDSVLRMSRRMPLRAVGALTVITVLSMVDAYWLASRNNERARQAATGGRCPNCGREIDTDLQFCHWCTTELGDGEETRPRET